MKKQTRFTEVENGKMYLSQEVDTYIKMLREAYTEMSEELEGLQKRSKKEKEQSAKETDRLRSDLESAKLSLTQEKLKPGSFNVEKIETLEQNKLELEKQLGEQTAEKENLAAQIKGHVEEKNIYKTQLEKQAGELDKATKKHNQFQNDLENEKKNVSELRKELLHQQEHVNTVQTKLEDETEKNSILQKQVGIEQKRNDRLKAEKKELEEENFNNSDDGKANAYISLLERTQDMANTYVSDIHTQMNQLHEEAKVSIQEQLDSASEQSTSTIEEANTKANTLITEAQEKHQELLSDAEEKRKEILTRAKTEYDGIRRLIEQASKEYANMVTNTSVEEIDWN